MTTSDKQRTAFCVEGRGLIVAGPKAGFQMGTSVCPEWENARPAAIVNVEKPWLVSVAFFMTLLGFGIQFFAVNAPPGIGTTKKKAAK